MALALALASVWVSASNDTPPNSSSTFPTNHQITRLGRRPKISQSFPFMPLGSNLQARPRPINTYVSSDLFNGKAISAVRAGDLGEGAGEGFPYPYPRANIITGGGGGGDSNVAEQRGGASAPCGTNGMCGGGGGK